MPIAMSIGEMRQKGTFRNNNPVKNTSGGADDNYADVLTCRGRFQQQKASKTLEQGEIVQNKGFEWICRFQAAIAINEDSIWVIGGTTYRISSWEKVDQMPHFYRFILNAWK
jgi:hypothetical protein